MNSNWPIGPFPKPPMQYDQSYFNLLVAILESTLQRARSPGPIEVTEINGGPP